MTRWREVLSNLLAAVCVAVLAGGGLWVFLTVPPASASTSATCLVSMEDHVDWTALEASTGTAGDATSTPYAVTCTGLSSVSSAVFYVASPWTGTSGDTYELRGVVTAIDAADGSSPSLGLPASFTASYPGTGGPVTALDPSSAVFVSSLEVVDATLGEGTLGGLSWPAADNLQTRDLSGSLVDCSAPQSCGTAAALPQAQGEAATAVLATAGDALGSLGPGMVAVGAGMLMIAVVALVVRFLYGTARGFFGG